MTKIQRDDNLLTITDPELNDGQPITCTIKRRTFTVRADYQRSWGRLTFGFPNKMMEADYLLFESVAICDASLDGVPEGFKWDACINIDVIAIRKEIVAYWASFPQSQPA